VVCVLVDIGAGEDSGSADRQPDVVANFLLEVLDQLQVSLFPFGSILNLLQSREICLLKTFVVSHHSSTILFRSLQVSLKALRLQNKFLPFVIHGFAPNFHVPNNLRKVFVRILKVSDIAESFLQFIKYRSFFIHGLRSHIVQLILRNVQLHFYRRDDGLLRRAISRVSL
jgi:hypothetical protein